MEIKLKNLDEVDFNSPEMKSEFKRIEKEGKELLESTIPDREAMNKPFII